MHSSVACTVVSLCRVMRIKQLRPAARGAFEIIDPNQHKTPPWLHIGSTVVDSQINQISEDILFVCEVCYCSTTALESISNAKYKCKYYSKYNFRERYFLFQG